MARKTRDEWLAGLKVGDKISVTFPGDELPSVGAAVMVNGRAIVGRFDGRPDAYFDEGHLRGNPACLLWMVSTGSGNTTGPRIIVSNRGPGLSLGVGVDDGR